MPKNHVRTWSHARELAQKARDKDYGFCIDHSTHVRVSKDKHGWRPTVAPNEAVYALVHFNAEIVYYHPDGRLSINLHGWDSITTKRRVFQHTPVTVSSNRGTTWLGSSGWGMPIDSCEEYFVDATNRTITGPDGVTVSETVRTRAPRPIPKTRNTLKKTAPGDVLRSPDGKPYIATQRRGCDDLVLVEYLGDLPAHPTHSAVGTDSIQMTSMFLLTMDGWTAAERFLLKKEVDNGA